LNALIAALREALRASINGGGNGPLVLRRPHAAAPVTQLGPEGRQKRLDENRAADRKTAAFMV